MLNGLKRCFSLCEIVPVGDEDCETHVIHKDKFQGSFKDWYNYALIR